LYCTNEGNGKGFEEEFKQKGEGCRMVKKRTAFESVLPEKILFLWKIKILMKDISPVFDLYC
jgi:hypothetical protein